METSDNEPNPQKPTANIESNPSPRDVVKSAVEENEDNNSQQEYPFDFTGQGGEYFGISFVNNLFTTMTLGFYGPWAKVRNLQYLYGNTALDDNAFHFNANPWKIFRTRIIAVLLFILYFVAENVQSSLAKIVFASMIIGYFIFLPILTVFVISFKLRYSAWRGIQFKFKNNFAHAYRVYLAPLAFVFAIGVSFTLPFIDYDASLEEKSIIFIESGDDEALYEEEMSEDELEDVYLSEDPDLQNQQSEPSELQENPIDNQEQTSEQIVADDNLDTDHFDDENEDEEQNPINKLLFLPAGILCLIFFLLLPYFDFINVRFLVNNVRFGVAHFDFQAQAKHYYKIYLPWLAFSFALAAGWAALIYLQIDSADQDTGGLLLMALIIASILYFPLAQAFFGSRRYNLMLNKTLIAEKHTFRANVPFWGFFWIVLSNTIAILLSFGLMKAWAKVRALRYKFDRTSLIAQGTLNQFLQAQQDEVNALGEEVADVFDLDIDI